MDNFTQPNSPLNPVSPSLPRRVLLAVVVSIVLTALVVGGGVYVWQKIVHQQQIAALEQEIRDVTQSSPLSQQSPVLAVSSSPVATAAPADTVKTYSQAGLGLSFDYPAAYSITSETFSDTAGGIVLVNNAAPEKPELRLLVNPDGFGPVFSDINYRLVKEGNRVRIAERVIDTPTQNNQDGYTVIASNFARLGQYTYWVQLSFKEGVQNYEQDLQTVINSLTIQ